MQHFNICAKEHYEKDGEKKTKWYKVGVMKITDKGKRFIKLFHQPDTEFFVFDKDEHAPVAETTN